MARKGINIRAGYDMQEFSKSSQNLIRSMRKTAGKMKSVGKSMATYITAPIIAMGALSLKAFDDQAKALAQVESGLRSTGSAAGFTLSELEKLAAKMQGESLFGDEEILKGATAQLLTFTNIAGEQFERTQQAALDLATRLDGDLKSSSIMLGKALNDPVANLSALSRAGIQFSTEQKAVVKSLVETNRLADAQTLILNELETQYGGSASAAARAGLGPLKQLQMSLGDLSEEFGKIIAEYIIPLADKLRGLIVRFQGFDSATKKTILVVAGLAAAVGPLLFALGGLVTVMTPLAAALGIGFAPLTAIIIGVIALAGAIVYVSNNLEQFKVMFSNAFVSTLNSTIDIVKNLGTAWVKLSDLLGLDIGQDFLNFMDGLKLETKESTKEFDSLEETISKVGNGLKKMANIDTAAIVPKIGGGDLVKKTTEAINDLSARMPALEMPVNLKLNFDASKIPQMLEPVKQEVTRFGEAIKGYGQDLNNMLQQFATQAAVFLGESIGDAINGSTDKDFGKQVLGIVGGFMKQLGALMITYAITMSGFAESIKNPLLWPVALAAGIAMVAAGQAFSNFASKGLEGGAGGSAGGFSGSAPSNVVTQPTEIILTSNIELSGREMIITQQRENSFRR